jgi:hypothetical protein
MEMLFTANGKSHMEKYTAEILSVIDQAQAPHFAKLKSSASAAVTARLTNSARTAVMARLKPFATTVLGPFTDAAWNAKSTKWAQEYPDALIWTSSYMDYLQAKWKPVDPALELVSSRESNNQTAR